MTEAREAAKAAAQEVIEQTEIAIRDLRESMEMRAMEAAIKVADESPWQYRNTELSRKCYEIAREVVDKLLGGKE